MGSTLNTWKKNFKTSAQRKTSKIAFIMYCNKLSTVDKVHCQEMYICLVIRDTVTEVCISVLG